jgi:hypothetical protein
LSKLRSTRAVRPLQKRFGITASEALTSSHPEFTANAGLTSVGIGYTLTYFLIPNWLLEIDSSCSWLLNSAQASPFFEEDLDAGLPPGADSEGVSIVCLVSAFPSEERERADSIAKRCQALLPEALVMNVLCPGVAPPASNSLPRTKPNRRLIDGSLADLRHMAAGASRLP